MIIFNGIKLVDKISMLCFMNDKNSQIEIPIDNLTADRISKYLSRISPPDQLRSNQIEDDE